MKKFQFMLNFNSIHAEAKSNFPKAVLAQFGKTTSNLVQHKSYITDKRSLNFSKYFHGSLLQRSRVITSKDETILLS